MGNAKTRINVTHEEINNEEEEGFSKTVPSHLVIGEVSNTDRFANNQILGKFVRVMHQPSGISIPSRSFPWKFLMYVFFFSSKDR
jgi:hypothetical protein